jgi:cytidyltransferase-like protein
MSNQPVIVCGGFDNIRSGDLRFLEEAARSGPLTVLVWPDEAIERATGKPPKFPLAERQYFLSAVRYVSQVLASGPEQETAVAGELKPKVWADREGNASREAFCHSQGIEYRLLTPQALAGFPDSSLAAVRPNRKKVIVTGCYDWFHSGHVRFFEEVSAYGDLYVIVGHDANIRLLKGEGHPLLPQAERRYVANSVRYVTQALISSGDGWVDADPEIRRLKPDIYAVNEDGDKGGKREYCQQMGIDYLVLKRTPAPGLPRRSSTDLRGF